MQAMKIRGVYWWLRQRLSAPYLYSLNLSRHEQSKYRNRALTRFVLGVFCFRTMFAGRKLGETGTFVQHLFYWSDWLIPSHKPITTAPTTQLCIPSSCYHRSNFFRTPNPSTISRRDLSTEQNSRIFHHEINSLPVNEKCVSTYLRKDGMHMSDRPILQCLFTDFKEVICITTAFNK